MYVVKGRHVKEEVIYRLISCDTIKEAREWKARYEETRHYEFPTIWIDKEED